MGGEVLSSIPVRRGVSLAAVFTFPQTCADTFCEFAKAALGSGASLQLTATVTSPRQFSLLAAVSDIQLGSGLTLKHSGLEFAIGVETYVGITGSLSLVTPPVSFTGAVRAGLQGLELSMTMNGLWKRAFGLNWLAFGNGILSIAIKPGIPLFGFQIGGEIRIGDLDSGREIKAKVYLEVDPLYPRRNYFYGSINSASIGAILNAFGVSVSLPSVLSQSGFPHGLKTSFAFDDIDLPGDLVIPRGFRLNGTVNILGYTLKALIEISMPSGIKINIRMAPLHLAGGLIKMYASSSDSSSGPYLVADLKTLPSPSINVTASGYIDFLGMIKRQAFLQITNTQYIFWIHGRFFLFDALLRVHASYGSLETAAFGVYGRLSTAWMTGISNKVKGIIDKGARDATRKISNAQSAVSSKQRDYDNAVQTLRQKRRDLDRAHYKFDEAIRTLRGKQHNVNNLCHIRSCSRRKYVMPVTVRNM